MAVEILRNGWLNKVLVGYHIYNQEPKYYCDIIYDTLDVGWFPNHGVWKKYSIIISASVYSDVHIGGGIIVAGASVRFIIPYIIMETDH